MEVDEGNPEIPVEVVNKNKKYRKEKRKSIND